MVLQGVEFDGAYALSVSEALECFKEVTSPLGPVNQSLHAIADFYEQPLGPKMLADRFQPENIANCGLVFFFFFFFFFLRFYAFRYICIDPAASTQSQAKNKPLKLL